jgi:hypothetical protein
MTSKAQLRANRENAKKSTGPRSAAGKRRVRTNALRHSLAVPLAAIPELNAAAEELARRIAGEHGADPRHVASARAIAEAQVDLTWIRAARHAALRLLVEDVLGWLDRTVPAFPLRPAVVARMPETAMAIRVAQADATGTLAAAIGKWGRIIGRLDRYERRALSQRNAAVRQWRAT